MTQYLHNWKYLHKSWRIFDTYWCILYTFKGLVGSLISCEMKWIDFVDMIIEYCHKRNPQMVSQWCLNQEGGHRGARFYVNCRIWVELLELLECEQNCCTLGNWLEVSKKAWIWAECGELLRSFAELRNCGIAPSCAEFEVSFRLTCEKWALSSHCWMLNMKFGCVCMCERWEGGGSEGICFKRVLIDYRIRDV